MRRRATTSRVSALYKSHICHSLKKNMLTDAAQPGGEGGAYPCLQDFHNCTEDREFHKGEKQLWFRCSDE